MSEKHYPYFGGSFDRIVFDGDGSVWVPEAENAKLRELGGEVASILFNLDVDRCGLCQRDSISHPCPVHTVKGGECLIKSELRELGVGVDG